MDIPIKEQFTYHPCTPKSERGKQHRKLNAAMLTYAETIINLRQLLNNATETATQAIRETVPEGHYQCEALQAIRATIRKIGASSESDQELLDLIQHARMWGNQAITFHYLSAPTPPKEKSDRIFTMDGEKVYVSPSAWKGLPIND